jgi:hypothetical protein
MYIALSSMAVHIYLTHLYQHVTVLKRWNNLHSKVLDHAKGKLHRLSDTMQLSLSSPSVQELGEDGRRTFGHHRVLAPGSQ